MVPPAVDAESVLCSLYFLTLLGCLFSFSLRFYSLVMKLLVAMLVLSLGAAVDAEYVCMQPLNIEECTAAPFPDIAWTCFQGGKCYEVPSDSKVLTSSRGKTVRVSCNSTQYKREEHGTDAACTATSPTSVTTPITNGKKCEGMVYNMECSDTDLSIQTPTTQSPASQAASVTHICQVGVTACSGSGSASLAFADHDDHDHHDHGPEPEGIFKNIKPGSVSCSPFNTCWSFTEAGATHNAKVECAGEKDACNGGLIFTYYSDAGCTTATGNTTKRYNLDCLPGALVGYAASVGALDNNGAVSSGVMRAVSPLALMSAALLLVSSVF